MSEEIQNASVVVPRTIVWSIVLNGVLGFGMLIAILFCIGDIDTVLNAPYIYPYIEIFVQGTGNVGASTGMAVIIIVLAFCTTIAVLASSSRMTWAFARDRGLPGWQSLSKECLSRNFPLSTLLPISFPLTCSYLVSQRVIQDRFRTEFSPTKANPSPRCIPATRSLFIPST